MATVLTCEGFTFDQTLKDDEAVTSEVNPAKELSDGEKNLITSAVSFGTDSSL